MWWDDVLSLSDRVAKLVPDEQSSVAPDAQVHASVVIDDSAGPVVIGSRARICAGAILNGPVVIGEDCLIGSRTLIRGATVIGARTKLGYCSEVKQALISDDVSIGPMCFVAESKLDRAVYLGAMVRTSNQRLDRRPVRVLDGLGQVAAEAEKLGCWIGEAASLGIQTIVLPGRAIAAHSIFEPRVTVIRNLPAGHYRLAQSLERVEQELAS